MTGLTESEWLLGAGYRQPRSARRTSPGAQLGSSVDAEAPDQPLEAAATLIEAIGMAAGDALTSVVCGPGTEDDHASWAESDPSLLQIDPRPTSAVLNPSPESRRSNPCRAGRRSPCSGDHSPVGRDLSNHTIDRNRLEPASPACRCISNAIHSFHESFRHFAADPCCARNEGQPRGCAAGRRIADAVHRERCLPRG